MNDDDMKKLREEAMKFASQPLDTGMDPGKFADVVKARAGIILDYLAQDLKFNRNGVDTYANIMACLYAAGAISDRVNNFTMLEAMTAIAAGINDMKNADVRAGATEDI